ncbi:MAG TPA: tellurite resistance TerB family protein [Saliniramus sp.]|nr:tellurite resistance TerB family protein [Saliniramus sp.]
MDIKRLLEGFLGQGASLGQGGSGSTGSAQAPGGAQIKDMIGRGLSGLPSAGGGLGGMTGGLAGGAAAGGLIALLMGSKKARKMGGTALTYGGLAVVGGLAYKAWSDYKANQQGGSQGPVQQGTLQQGSPVSVPQLPAPPAGSAFDLTSQRDAEGADMRLTLVRAMISAANADGHIDQNEHAQIQQQIQTMELAADEKAFLFDQLNAPSDPIAIARLSGGEEQSAEIYLASALALDVDTPEEQRYLERLADALRLPAALRAELDTHVAAAKQG